MDHARPYHAAKILAAPIAGISTSAMSRSARSAAALACRSMGLATVSGRGVSAGAAAASFVEAPDAFGAAWAKLEPLITQKDYDAHRRQRAWTAWKHAMHDARLPLPTQLTSGQLKCSCGAEIDIAAVCPPLRNRSPLGRNRLHRDPPFCCHRARPSGPTLERGCGAAGRLRCVRRTFANGKKTDRPFRRGGPRLDQCQRRFQPPCC